MGAGWLTHDAPVRGCELLSSGASRRALSSSLSGFGGLHQPLISKGRGGLPADIDTCRRASSRKALGPENALGEVTLVMPNSHKAYLDDTLGKTLFHEEARAFSHGCIRADESGDLAIYPALQP